MTPSVTTETTVGEARALLLARIERELGKVLPSLESLGFFEPHAGQVEVMGGAKRFNVMKCGRRFGKTDMLLRLVTEGARWGYPVAYFAPSYPMLSDAWRELTLKLSRWKGVKVIQSEHRVEMPMTGGSIDCWSLGDEANRTRGRKYKRVCLDECALVPDLLVAWTESIAPTLMDLGGDAWFGSTPKLGSTFDDLYWRGQQGMEGWASWELPTHNNPFISAEEIEVMRGEMSEAAYNREILARSDIEGSDLVYPQFSAVRHVRVAATPWEDCRWRVIGFDPGGGDPTALVPIGVDSRGWFAQYGELYRQKGTVSLPEVVSWISEWDKRGKLDAVVVDPSAKGWVEGLRAHGFPAYPAVNRREEGFEVVSWLLDGERPRLTFDPSAVECIAEFKDYEWDKRRMAGGSGSATTKTPGWHHADGKDALRYGCVWIVRNLRGRPEGSRKLRVSKPAGYRPMGIAAP